MSFLIKPERLTRYKDILRVVIKHFNKDLLKIVDINNEVFKGEHLDEKVTGDPSALSDDLQSLGTTFIKLGQSLSMRPDLLPKPYHEALSQLQDDIKPFSNLQATEVIESELGVKLESIYSEFDHKPIATASIGQVYKAKLRDGRNVVVKVQRPNIQEQINRDLDDLKTIAHLLERHSDWAKQLGLSDIIQTFSQTLLKELNYEQEAHNLSAFNQYLKAYKKLHTPKPITDLCSTRVLTMSFIHGKKVTELSGYARTELDADNLATELCKAYLDQILIHGFVHADPHPGNILLTQKHELALLDLGMIAHVSNAMRRQLSKLLLALCDNDGHAVADICIDISTAQADYDRDKVILQVNQHINEHLHSVNSKNKLGSIILGLVRIAIHNKLRPANELSLLGKTLLYLDEISRLLAPNFNPTYVAQQHVSKLLKQQLKSSLTPTNITRHLLDIQNLSENLPKNASRILNKLANNQLSIKVDSLNESRLLQTLEKIANRISMGLVLAALIIGAALMMPIESNITLWGYPAIAIALFITAAVTGLILVISILLQDRTNGP